MSAKPELLAPAGSLTMLKTALAFGADAVYAGQPRYSLRVRNNEFGSLAALAEGIDFAHGLGRQVYLVSNIFPHNTKVRTYLADMEDVVALKPDALIMADPGLIDLVRNRWPELPVHLSVQANTVNFAAVRFWQKLGIKRVILSREITLNDIAEIRQECPEMELEVFVHGALCIAYSGRCLLSGYFNKRDANQGTCTNSCRWDYRLHQGQETAEGDVTGRHKTIPIVPEQPTPHFVADGASELASRLWLLEESERPGELMPVEEDEHGTYILNSKDLRAIEHVQRLLEIGVDSLKIEGRTKSPYYAARTCQTYRQAIDAAREGRTLDPALFDQLDGLANRGYTDGFFQRNKDKYSDTRFQNYARGHSESARSLYVGDVADYRDGQAEIVVKNRFSVGDRVEIIQPGGNQEWIIPAMENLEGQAMSVAPGSGHRVRIPVPAPCSGAFIARFVA